MSQFNYKTDVGEVLANYRLKNTGKGGESWADLEKSGDYLKTQRRIDELVKANVPDAKKLKKDFDRLKKEGKSFFWKDMESLRANFDIIKKGVNKLYDEFKAPDIARTAYIKQKAMLDTRIQKAKTIPATGDTATARTEFDDALKKMETEEGNKDYVKAMAELKEVDKKIGALIAAKHKALLAGATSDTATPDDAKDAVNAIPDDEIGSLPQEYQIKLLKKLQSVGKIKDNANRELLLAQGKIYKNITLNPAFREWDVKVRNELLEELDLPDLKEVRKKWNEDSEEADKMRKKFLTDVLTKHCNLMGIPVPPIEFVNNAANPGKSYGGFVRGKRDGSTPDKMKINLHTDVRDFKEQLITIVHENTHNYQWSMIKDPSKITDQDLKNQIEIFDLNTDNGYIGSAKAKEMGDFGLYDKQPKEEHAEEFGQYVAAKLLTK